MSICNRFSASSYKDCGNQTILVYYSYSYDMINNKQQESHRWCTFVGTYEWVPIMMTPGVRWWYGRMDDMVGKLFIAPCNQYENNNIDNNIDNVNKQWTPSIHIVRLGMFWLYWGNQRKMYYMNLFDKYLNYDGHFVWTQGVYNNTNSKYLETHIKNENFRYRNIVQL